MKLEAGDLPQFVRDALPKSGDAKIVSWVHGGKVRWFVNDVEIKQTGR